MHIRLTDRDVIWPVGIRQRIFELSEIIFDRLTLLQKLFNNRSRQRSLELRATLHAHTRPSAYAPDTFSGAQTIVADWLRRQFGEEALLGIQQRDCQFEGEGKGFEIRSDDTWWALRAYYPDPTGTIQVTELVFKKNKGQAVDYLLTQDVIPNSPHEAPPPHAPAFIKELAREFAATDCGQRLQPRLEVMSHEAAISRFSSYLGSSQRRQPVIIFVQPLTGEGNSAQKEAEVFATNVYPIAQVLAERAAGFANVVILTPSCAAILEKELGQNYAVEPANMRVFPPSASPRSATSMWTAINGVRGENVRVRWQHFGNGLWRYLAAESKQLVAVPSVFLELRHKQLFSAQIQTSAAELEEQAFNELLRLTAHIETVEAGYAKAVKVNNAMAAEALKGCLIRLHDMKPNAPDLASDFDDVIARTSQLRSIFMAAAYGITKPYEEKYEALADWVEENYGNRLVLTDSVKAILRNPKKAKYQDVNVIYAAVELLATHCHGMKTGNNLGSTYHKQLFSDGLKRLGLEDTPSLTSQSREQFASEYTATVEGQAIALDRHLKHGNSPDPTQSVRIYYGWDEARKRIVVGSLAGHKRNRLTN